MTKKISKSRASSNHFSVKSKPISKSMEEKLRIVSTNANKKIVANNIIYQQSNSHSNEHIVSTNICYGRQNLENIDKMILETNFENNYGMFVEEKGHDEDIIITKESRKSLIKSLIK